MAKQLERQVEDVVKELRVGLLMADMRRKERLLTPLMLRELAVMSMLTVTAGIGSYLYKNTPQIYESVKNYMEYLF